MLFILQLIKYNNTIYVARSGFLIIACDELCLHMLVGFPPPPSALILESLQTVWSFTTVYHLPLSYALSALAALHLNYFCLAATYLHISALR